MALLHGSGGSVLVVERDASIRLMLQALLRRAGFTVQVADGDALPLPDDDGFDVLVRDVNLPPHDREAMLQELVRVPAERMQRTVLTTTTPAVLVAQSERVRPFAVIAKPFDIDVLIRTIGQCAERARESRSARTPRKTPPPAAIDSKVGAAQLRKFVRSVPTLRALLASEAGSTRELFLRSEMRRTALELASVLDNAARGERDGTRAAILGGAALVAAELAQGDPAAASPSSRRGH